MLVRSRRGSIDWSAMSWWSTVVVVNSSGGQSPGSRLRRLLAAILVACGNSTMIMWSDYTWTTVAARTVAWKVVSGRGRPACTQVSGRSRCPWVPAGDRSFPLVLARKWHVVGGMCRETEPTFRLFLILAGAVSGAGAGLMPGCRRVRGFQVPGRGRGAGGQGIAGRARRRARTSASRPWPGGSRRVSCPAWRTSRAGTAMSRRRRVSIMALPPRTP